MQIRAMKAILVQNGRSTFSHHLKDNKKTRAKSTRVFLLQVVRQDSLEFELEEETVVSDRVFFIIGF